jgi:hypothetical protein
MADRLLCELRHRAIEMPGGGARDLHG